MPQSGLSRKMVRVSVSDGVRSSDPPARLRRLEDRANNPVMGPAAAQIAGKCQPDLGLARLRVAIKQRFGQHDHAGDAVAALRRLLRHESGLQRVRPLDGTEAFERGDLRLPERADWRDAGAHRGAVDEHRAGAALAKPAAELGGIEAKIIAQHVEQRRVGLGHHAVHRTVHLEADSHDAKLRLKQRQHLAPALAPRRGPTRRYAISIPGNYSPSTPVPLILALSRDGGIRLWPECII